MVVLEPLIDPDVADEAFALATRQLFELDRVDMVHVGVPISGDTDHLAALRASASDLADVAGILLDQESGTHTIFDMPEGFDGYMRSLSSHQRSNYRRKLKKLGQEFDVDMDVVRSPTRLETEFEAFIDMHQRQWKAVNKLGHFDDWPGSREFSWDLVRTMGQSDGVRLIRLLAGRPGRGVLLVLRREQHVLLAPVGAPVR